LFQIPNAPNPFDPEVRKKVWAQAISKRSLALNVVMIIFIDIAPQVADFVFEAMNMTQYHRNKDYWWLALTLVPIFLPGLVMGFAELCENCSLTESLHFFVLFVCFPIVPIIT
jgi:hypothetical protein